MLKRGNKKTGKSIYQWSIPAGKTCPGKTKACIKCYALNGNFRRHVVGESFKKNYRKSKLPGFVDRVIKFIETKKLTTVRVHVSGDFYSLKYTENWLKIVKACPQVKFWAYTRSWRVPEILPALRALAKQPNFTLWLSADKHSGKPPSVAKASVAYMQMTELDTPPKYAKLVFRVKRQTVQKKVNEKLVCPSENGITKTTCEKCQICYNKNKLVTLT
jgi:hypothetical protein